MKRYVMISMGLAALIALAGAALAVPPSAQTPAPAVRDQVLHDRGNLTTTVNNYGYIGGYRYAGRPSGRWPANSEHDYLAEMKFWIGGVNAAGDTLLADTDEDFNPLPNWAAAATPTDILLSTDTTRYPYDPADTVGLGIGFPAYGWRVWDVATDQWAYNQVYHTLSSSYYPGGPVGVQESICRYGDDALGSPVMDLQITQTVRQWNYTEIRDFILFTLEITNASSEDYHDVAIGIYCDYDVGGDDPVSGDNGRLGDLVALDTTLDLAWTYDEDGYDPGWGPGVETGFMGTALLSTPGDVGMTSFNTGQWEFLPTTDIERYRLIANDDFDESLPPTDQYYVQGVKGFDLAAGQTVRIDFVMAAGPNAELLKSVVEKAQTLYANRFIASRPPDAAHLRAAAGNHAVTLKWDNTAEASIDPATGIQDFKGYKVFRSTDLGATWGTLKVNADYSVGPDYVPLKIYLSDDFGRICHSFAETDLVNGKEYWYAVVAFDSSSQELDFTSGNPSNSANIVRVFPRSNPLGYETPQASIEHTYAGTWEASFDSVTVIIVDESAITGDQYAVTFSTDCFPTWNLIDLTTGDTVLAAQDQFEGDHGTYPIADGLQIAVANPRVPDTVYQSGFATEGQTTLSPLFLEQFSSSYGCNDNFRNDVELRFTETGSTGYDWFTGDPVSLPFEVWNVVTNTQLGVWIADWSGDGAWTQDDEDYIILTNYDYDGGAFHPEVLEEYLTWITALDHLDTPAIGDVLRIDGPRLMSADDQFVFSSYKIVGSQAERDITTIRVVPNPYLGQASWETSEGVRKLQFVNLPEECSIRIYTLAGELIRTLEHANGTGTEDWNMLSEGGRGIASGVYLYNVQSDYGHFTGKFAVIK
jgi:hypothetical protein